MATIKKSVPPILDQIKASAVVPYNLTKNFILGDDYDRKKSKYDYDTISSNMYDKIENILNKGELEDFYQVDSVELSNIDNNNLIDYDNFIAEDYIQNIYFALDMNMTNQQEFEEYTTKIIREKGELNLVFKNIQKLNNPRFPNFFSQPFSIIRLNLYGLLSFSNSNESNDFIQKILTNIARSESMVSTLKHLNIGNNNIEIKNEISIGASAIFSQHKDENISDRIRRKLDDPANPVSPFLEPIKRLTNLEELNICNNNISHVPTLFYLLGLQTDSSKKLKILTMSNNLRRKSEVYFFFNSFDATQLIIQKIENLILKSIEQNTSMTYLDVRNNGLDSQKIMYAIEKIPIDSDKQVKFDINNLFVSDYFSLINKKKIAKIDLSSIKMNYKNPVNILDDYELNIDVEKYLNKYLGKDPIGIFNDQNTINYINALNDKNEKKSSLMLRHLSPEERKIKLIDIINYHQMIMGLSINEKKYLLSQLGSYLADVIEYGSSKEKTKGIELGPTQMSFNYQHTLGRSQTKKQNTFGNQSPWQSYKIKQTDFSIPFQILSYILEEKKDGSFDFFQRINSLVSNISENMNCLQILCEEIKKKSNITELNLSYCSINDNLFFKIYDAINNSTNRGITHINLINNDLTDKSCLYIANLISLISNKENTVYVNISNNNISVNGLLSILLYLVLNTNKLKINIIYSLSSINENAYFDLYKIKYNEIRKTISAEPFNFYNSNLITVENIKKNKECIGLISDPITTPCREIINARPSYKTIQEKMIEEKMSIFDKLKKFYHNNTIFLKFLTSRQPNPNTIWQMEQDMKHDKLTTTPKGGTKSYKKYKTYKIYKIYKKYKTYKKDKKDKKDKIRKTYKFNKINKINKTYKKK